MTPIETAPALAPAALTPTALSKVSNDLRLALMRIARRIRFESADELAPHQFSVLCRLEESPRTPRELADHEKVSAPSMTRTVNGLVERGLVQRADDPTDGRQVILSLTPGARTVLKDIRRKRDQWMVVRLKRLTPQEQDILRKASQILARVASE